MTIFLRGYNWLKRFRHRCGYGVHSPSDFYFITNVVYEKLPYYAYSRLHHIRRVVCTLPHHREKVDKLFLRVTNFLQPQRIVEFGTGCGLSTLYMNAGCKACDILTLDNSLNAKVKKMLSKQSNISYAVYSEDNDLGKLFNTSISLVHIGHTDRYAEIFEALLPYVANNSCIIISFPYEDRQKERWWKNVVKDERTCVTFDLYDVGIVFFNKDRVKEHRIVNFL